MGSWKPDCLFALQRKWPRTLAAARQQAFSPVRFRSENRRIAALSGDVQEMQASFSATQTEWRSEMDSNSPYPFDALTLDVYVSYR